jgi:hypothetical protein
LLSETDSGGIILVGFNQQLPCCCIFLFMQKIAFSKIELNGFLFPSTVPPWPAGISCLKCQHRQQRPNDDSKLSFRKNGQGTGRHAWRAIKPAYSFTNTSEFPLFTIPSLQWKTTTQ